MFTSSIQQSLSLLALRVSLGLLMVWWGLAKILKPKLAMTVQKKFYHDLFPVEELLYAFGHFQIGIGLLVVMGLFRQVAVTAQLTITGFSAAMIATALIDPFGLWLPVEKISGIQHLFYPTVIILCSAGVMVAFRKEDRLNLDTVLVNMRQRDRSQAVAIE